MLLIRIKPPPSSSLFQSAPFLNELPEGGQQEVQPLGFLDLAEKEENGFIGRDAEKLPGFPLVSQLGKVQEMAVGDQRELAAELDVHNLRTCNIVCAAAHCDCDIQTACADREHTEAAAGRGVRVRADERLARDAEALQMNLVADAVARAGEIQAVLLCAAADETVIVCILEAVLKRIVVDISDRALCADTRHAHSLKFEVSHCAGCILRQRLVDADADFCTADQFTLYEMCREDFFRHCESHFGFLPFMHKYTLIFYTKTGRSVK